MIKANELRLGNWVTLIVTPKQRYYGKITAIEEHRFSITCSKMIYDFYEDLEPIPLTPEILEKAGFVNHGKKGIIPFAWFKNGLAITSSHPKGIMISTDENDNSVEVPLEFECHFYSGYGTNIHLKHLHQLQNLYFALTGEELQIKL